MMAVGVRHGTRLLAVLAVMLTLSRLHGADASELGARVVSTRWLESVERLAADDDAALLQLATHAGKTLQSLDDVPYVPFQPVWYVLELAREKDRSPPEFIRFTALQRRELDAVLIVDGRVVARAAGGYARASPWEALTKPDVSLPLGAWQGERATVLLRCVTTERLPLRSFFVSAEDIREGAVIRAGFLMFFSGCALVFITIQFLFYWRMHERASRDYALFVGASLFLHLNRAGYLSFDLWPGGGSLYFGDVQDFIKLGVIILAMRALESYLEIGMWSPVLHRANRTLQIVTAATALLFQFVSLGAFQAVISLAYAPLCLWALAVTLLAIRAERRGAKLLLIAWAGLASTALYVNFAILGWFPLGPYVQFIVPLGMIWEMVFNGGGLLVRLDELREEHHAAHLRETEVQGLTRLVRVVCHDISNPLMVVRFALDRIRTHYAASGTPPGLQDPLRLAEKGERAIEAVIQDVRAMEQLRASGGKLEVSPVDLAALARETLTLFQNRAAEKQVKLNDTLPTSVSALGVPGIIVRSVISNIVANALKFSPSGSTITLELETAPGRVGLRIIDSGPGIPDETLAALARAEPLSSRLGSAGERGTGFGLQIARDFTAAMGGSLTFLVPARETGAGTAVTIWLRAA